MSDVNSSDDSDSAFSKLMFEYQNDIVGSIFTDYVQHYCLNDKSRFTRYILAHIRDMNKPSRLNYLFDMYGLPTDMTLKERICYFQLLES